MQNFSILFRQAFIGAALISGCVFEVAAATPNDPRFNSQWHLSRISAPAAWNVTTGSREQVVVVLDTGVKYNHPDLAANMWRNPGETGLDANGAEKATNRVDDDGNGYVDDLHGIDVADHDSDPFDEGFIRGAVVVPYTHGTSVAGVIGAVGNNANGTVGVNWAVSMMAIRLIPLDLNTNWHNPQITAGLIESFQYVLKMKRRGANIVAVCASVTMASYSQALKEAIDACGREGIVTVFSAGNNGMNNDQVGFSVSSYNSPSVLVVGDTLRDDTLDPISSYGKSTVHLTAPGDGIVTTDRDDFCCTSSATPQVAGAVALLKGVQPDASAAQIRAAILGSVDQPSSLSGKVTSNGRLNVAKAIIRLTNSAAPTIVVAAHPAGPRTRLGDPIQITFSRPMDRSSVEGAIRFTPAVSGRFEWDNDDRTVTLIPDSPLARTNYTGTILRAALDIRGEPLDGNYSGVLQNTVVDDFQWTFGFPVANDDFSDARVLSGATGSQTGTTRNALPEVEEPDIARDRRSAASVWYRWTAPATGWFTFETLRGTAIDTLLGVYTGATLPALTESASSDNYGGSIYSRTSFEAIAGATYSIAVATKSYEANKSILDEARVGAFTLSWYPTPAPGFSGSQFSPGSAVPGAVVTLFGTNFTGVSAVLFNGVSATFTNALTNNADLRITAVVPGEATSGPITILTPHGNATTAGSFTVVRPQLSVRQAGASQLEISWSGTNPQFTLEQSNRFEDNSWSPTPQPPVFENGRTKILVPMNVGPTFFRVIKR